MWSKDGSHEEFSVERENIISILYMKYIKLCTILAILARECLSEAGVSAKQLMSWSVDGEPVL